MKENPYNTIITCPKCGSSLVWKHLYGKQCVDIDCQICNLNDPGTCSFIPTKEFYLEDENPDS